MKAHIKEHPAWFHRFDAIWTPTTVLLDPDGKERVRIEGYLANREFLASLRNGLGRLAFLRKDYPEAERWYGDVAQNFSDTLAAPEAIYWRNVSEYRRTNDHGALGRAAQQLHKSYPDSLWAMKSGPWLPKGQEEAAD